MSAKFGLKINTTQRGGTSGSKRNRTEFGFENNVFDPCEIFGMDDLPSTPTKRLKTPRSSADDFLGALDASLDFTPKGAKGLTLDHVAMPAELSSPRLHTPEGWKEFMSIMAGTPMLDIPELRFPTPRRASAPTPADPRGMNFLTPLNSLRSESEFLQSSSFRSTSSFGSSSFSSSNPQGQSNRASSHPRGSPYPFEADSIMRQFSSRKEAEEYSRRLTAELNACSNISNRSSNSSNYNNENGSSDTIVITPSGRSDSGSPNMFQFPKLRELSNAPPQPAKTPKIFRTSQKQDSAIRPLAESRRVNQRRCVPVPAGSCRNNSRKGSKEKYGIATPEMRVPRTNNMVTTPTPRKRKLCRHFLKGFCKQGDKCNFLHDASIFSPDSHKVFLGGLPPNTTSEGLVEQLRKNGYKVTNRPQVLRGFSPKVCLESAEIVRKLVKKSHIRLWKNVKVDVRPYQDKKPDSEARRSVFLGGLPDNCTTADIKSALESAGAKLRNTPVLKTGFAPQVILDSAGQAQKLVQTRQILCKGKMIDVRPFVDLRPRKARSH